MTLSNSGDAALTVSSVQVSGATVFPIDAGCAAATLGAGASCKVGVTFKPAAAQAYSGTLTISTNGGTVKATLKGTGTAGAVTPPPTPLPVVAPTRRPTTGDQDGDGIADSADKCPTVAGMLLDGCPLDRDGDGVSDGPDDCPTKAGTLANGCPSDLDHDNVPDQQDKCLHAAGNLANGCPSQLNASVRGRWRVNALYTQLVFLSVDTTTGSNIELRCTRRAACGFKRRVIHSTKRRITGLTRFFNGHKLLPAGVRIVVIVTRRRQIGTYESLRTRTGRRLPKRTQRCVAGRKGGTIQQCY